MVVPQSDATLTTSNTFPCSEPSDSGSAAPSGRADMPPRPAASPRSPPPVAAMASTAGGRALHPLPAPRRSAPDRPARWYGGSVKRGLPAFEAPSRAGWELCSSVRSWNRRFRRPRALQKEVLPVLRNWRKSAQHVVPGSFRVGGTKPPGTEAAPWSSRGFSACARRRHRGNKEGP